MATPPDFSVGQVLTAAQMNAVGLWLISSGTSSGTTAYNYDGVFTSDYENYRIVLSAIETSVADRALRLNFRVGGATETSSDYNYAFRGLRSNNTGGDTATGSVAFTEIGVFIGNFANVTLGSATIDILNPVSSSTRTFGLSNAVGYESNLWQMRQGGFAYNVNKAFDGFRITLNSTGNIAYKYAIYGYNQ